MKVNITLLAGVLLLAAVSQAPAQVGRGGETPVRLLPDLKTSLISANGTKAIVRVVNVCKGDAPAARVELWVSPGEKKGPGGLVMEGDVPPLTGTSSMKIGQRSADVVFTLDASDKFKTFDGKFIRLKVDPLDKISEASEGNNWWEPDAQPFPDKGGYCDAPPIRMPTPSFNITGKQKVANGTTYMLTVSNWNAYPVAWFPALTFLPPTQCGDQSVKARMLAHIMVVKHNNGLTYDAGCKPLDNPQSLQTLKFTAAGVLSDLDKVKIILEDRGVKAKTASEPFLVGWYDWSQALVPLGCKNFLGRNGNYLCNTDEGFSACEKQRQQGKPLKCTRAGKPQ
jgi:hypothetical protein